MYIQRISVAVAFLFCFLEAVWAAGCANVTIKTQEEADKIRKDCKTIQGDLIFDEDLSESINLEGIELIEGDMVYYYGDPEFESGKINSTYPTKRKPFTIQSSTLKTVNGSIYFWALNGLSELRLPKLTRVQDSFALSRMFYLKTLDITSLTHLGSFNIEANHLTELKHKGLEGFTDSRYSNSLQFWGLKVSSLDSWFKYPLNASFRTTGGSHLYEQAPVQISSYSLPNIRNITIGWANTSKIWVRGDDIAVTLGSSETKTMDIGLLQISGDIKITRASTVKELNVQEFYFESSGFKEIDLSMFDKLTNLTIYRHGDLQRIRMPSKAVDWKDMTIDISYNQNLTLTSEFRDPETKKDKFWYWPKGNISSIIIRGNPLSTEFL
ncbi:hypothetical protein ACHAPT_005979 [Fusarium lateritium]